MGAGVGAGACVEGTGTCVAATGLCAVASLPPPQAVSAIRNSSDKVIRCDRISEESFGAKRVRMDLLR